MMLSPTKGRFGALFLSSFICFAAAAAEPDKERLREQLRTGRFAELEAELSARQAAYREGRIGDEEAYQGIVALSAIDSELRPAYDRWIEEYPRSYVARLARGYYLSTLGWFARGAAYASETASWRFKDMRAYFAHAMQDLEASIALDARPVLSYATMARVARADRSFGDIATYLERALALDPKAFNVRMSYLLGIRPEWGGSLEEMERFVAESLPSLTSEQVAKMRRVLDNSRSRAEIDPGERLSRSGQYEAAVSIYDAALARRPSARGYAARGFAYSRLKQHEKALENFNRALELDPDDGCCGSTHSNRAYSHFAVGERDAGLADFVYAAREMGDQWAAQQLAGMYAYGWYGMKVDPARARPWCDLAARQGDAWSMYCLGHIYRTGWGAPRDIAKGLYWLESAAERGVAGAQYDLGWVHWHGDDVPWNAFKALQWWGRAAAQGDEPAVRQLATLALGPAFLLLLLGLVIVRRRRRIAVTRQS